MEPCAGVVLQNDEVEVHLTVLVKEASTRVKQVGSDKMPELNIGLKLLRIWDGIFSFSKGSFSFLCLEGRFPSACRSI